MKEKKAFVFMLLLFVHSALTATAAMTALVLLLGLVPVPGVQPVPVTTNRYI
jgi:hypothetical protein